MAGKLHPYFQNTKSLAQTWLATYAYKDDAPKILRLAKCILAMSRQGRPKYEIRNKFKILNSKLLNCVFEFWLFDIRVCFGFRYLIFEFLKSIYCIILHNNAIDFL